MRISRLLPFQPTSISLFLLFSTLDSKHILDYPLRLPALSSLAMSDQSPTTEPQPEEPQQEQQQPELPGPGAFLKGVVGQKVVVRLNSGVDYRGTS